MIRIVGLIFLYSSLSNGNTTNVLADCKWNIYKTVEVISNSQKSYTKIYQGNTFISKDKAERFYDDLYPYTASQNRLGGPLILNSDSTGKIKNADILWHPIDDNTIFVANDSSGNIRHNDYFLGIFKIMETTDSTAILQKNITTNGNWIRTFYLRKRLN